MRGGRDLAREVIARRNEYEQEEEERVENSTSGLFECGSASFETTHAQLKSLHKPGLSHM